MKASDLAILQQNLARAQGRDPGPPAVRLRPNRSNTGKPFEHLILEALERYDVLGVMRARKVDPPVAMKDGKIILRRNPFLDFVGAWTERGGRALFFEAKSTTDPYLPVNAAGGISPGQCQAIREWSRAGAVVFVLWQYRRQVALLPFTTVMAAELGGDHFKWPAGIAVPEHGFGYPDFIEVLRQIIP